MVARALSTTFLLVGIAGIFIARASHSDALTVVAWIMIVGGFFGQVSFGLLYFFFFRDE